MNWQNKITELPHFKSAKDRAVQIESVAIALEVAADRIDITVIECVLSAIRALAGQTIADLERAEALENEINGGGS